MAKKYTKTDHKGMQELWEQVPDVVGEEKLKEFDVSKVLNTKKFIISKK